MSHYAIAGNNDAGRISHHRDTAVEAIKKAAEMMGVGMTDICITDTETDRVYQEREFPVLLITDNPSRIEMKKNAGARWEITVDGRPRTYDHDRELAIEAAQLLKRKRPHVDVTVRDLEGVEETIVIPAQQPQVRR
jgi:hypothetical protein